MGSVDDLFERNRDLIAFRLASGELPGLIQKRLVVPRGTSALIEEQGGIVSLLREGQEQSGVFTVLLARSGEFSVAFRFGNLPSRDGFPFAVSLTAALYVDTETVASLRQFARRFPGRSVRLADVRAWLEPAVRNAVAAWIAAADAAEVATARAHDLQEPLARGLEESLGGTGVQFEGALSVELRSEAFEQERTRVAAQARQSEQRERRMREVVEFLQNREEGKKLLEHVQDPSVRSALVARLVLRDDAAPPLDDRGLDEVYRAMQSLLGADVSSGTVPDSAVAIWTAGGSSLLRMEPREPFEVKVWNLEEPIRSVRESSVGLLVGGKRTAIVLDPSTGDVRRYRFPESFRPNGGINALAIFGEHLYATHSEFGVARWRLDAPGSGAERVYDPYTSGRRTTRAVVESAGRLLFASGMDLFEAMPDASEAPPRRYASRHGNLTAVAASETALFAATEAGAILQWERGTDAEPAVLLKRGKPVLSLRLATLRGVPHLVYAFDDTSVHARVVGQAMETEFEARGATFAVADAATDLVCAAGSGSRSLYLWQPGKPARPFHVANLSRHLSGDILALALARRPGALEA